GLAITIGDELEEIGTVQVGGRAVRKGERARADLVDALEPVLQHGRAQIHVENSRSSSAGGGARGFFVRGQALDEPAWLNLIGRVDLSHAEAQDGVGEGGQPGDVVDVKDVRVLVRDEQVQPVVEVVEHRLALGAGRKQMNQVVGQHAGRSVG